MLSISLGPFAISISQLIVFVGLAVFWVLTYMLTRHEQRHKESLDNIFKAIVLGFIAARLVFIITMWQVYRENWWQLLNISDGGFVPIYGWLSGVLVLLYYARATKKIIKSYAIAGTIASFTMVIPSVGAFIYQSTIELPQSIVHTLEGQEVNLQALKGQPIVINIWASWCPPCRKEMPVLERAQKNNPAITFAFINQGENVFTVQNFMHSQNLELKNVFVDPHSNVSRESGAAGLPTTLFYNRDGKLLSSHMGELSQASLHYNIQKISQNNFTQ